MSKGVDAKKAEKKEPTKTLKEKRLEKKAKKDKKQGAFLAQFYSIRLIKSWTKVQLFVFFSSQ